MNKIAKEFRYEIPAYVVGPPVSAIAIDIPPVKYSCMYRNFHLVTRVILVQILSEVSQIRTMKCRSKKI